jgi:hypothetical protein
MSSKTNGFSQGTVLQVAYSVLTLTSCVVLARTGLGFLRPRPLTASDAFVIFAFACYATMCALYISLSPLMQRLYDVSNGRSPRYPELAAENTRMTKMLFAAFCLFWMTLWSIKFSLLFLYRKLLVGLARRYTIIWWAIAGICIVVCLHARLCGLWKLTIASDARWKLRALHQIMRRYHIRLLGRKMCKLIVLLPMEMNKLTRYRC